MQNGPEENRAIFMLGGMTRSFFHLVFLLVLLINMRGLPVSLVCIPGVLPAQTARDQISSFLQIKVARRFIRSLIVFSLRQKNNMRWKKMNNVRCYILCTVAAFFSSINVSKADQLPDVFNKSAKERVVLSTQPYFTRPQSAIAELIALYEENGKTNHLCTVGYRWDDGHIIAFAHWQEAKMLALWEGTVDEDRPDTSLALSRRHWIFGKDTVKTQADINGSTYLVTEKYWQTIAADCEKNGEQYTVASFALNSSE
ncbi:hypothetical protein QCD60_08675 [Pokkaliibacter sp. MBI-7]|uniref:hypothetical protein n=1 Tax=Pokkaliibacter sp. MBI-7 TaxID=3040600 RepID=UPI00244C7A1E|nr:hypothetical protein [Pokkaliibacter sp. MBI-7]MDH2432640.1 hypothetical protein [Pokkaliibacter sp. MBI-7]